MKERVIRNSKELHIFNNLIGEVLLCGRTQPLKCLGWYIELKK